MNIFRRKNYKESVNDFIKYTKNDSFKAGKRYFSLGNFGIFKLMDNLGELTCLDAIDIKGIPFADRTSFDGDEFHFLYIGFSSNNKECGIYINNGCSLQPYDNGYLRKPLKVASSFKELFNNPNSNNIFQEEFFDEIDDVVKGYLPEYDLSLFFEREIKNSLIISYNEYNPKELNDFFKNTSIKVEDEFKYFPYELDYEKLVRKANEKLGKQEYFYILFQDAILHGIGRFKDLTQNQICDFLCLGLFYRMTEIDLKYYELNNKSHKNVYEQ